MSVAVRRKPTNVSLDAKMVEQAKAQGINVSRACEAGLAAELKKAREARFRTGFAPTAAFWNEYHEKHGLPLAKYRMF